MSRLLIYLWQICTVGPKSIARWSKERALWYAVRAKEWCVMWAVFVHLKAAINLSRTLENGYSTADQCQAMDSSRCPALPVQEKIESKQLAKLKSMVENCG
jgi:hypothetical protein